MIAHGNRWRGDGPGTATPLAHVTADYESPLSTWNESPRVAYLVADLGLVVLVGVGILRRRALSRRALDQGLAWPDDDRDRALHAQAGGDLG
jgi:hypothetical protein